MNERAFRLDFVIAIAALIVSALTAATLIYQTHVIGNQYAATIWPYLSVTETYEAHGERFALTNDGLGPALVRSAQLSVDGKPVSSWYEYLRALASAPAIRAFFSQGEKAYLTGGTPPRGSISAASVGPGTTVRPGDSAALLTLSFPNSVPMQALLAHALALDFCYCSLNGSCWNLHWIAGRSTAQPQPAAHCTSFATISTTGLVSPTKAIRSLLRAKRG